jgi:hypothetical protein
MHYAFSEHCCFVVSKLSDQALLGLIWPTKVTSVHMKQEASEIIVFAKVPNFPPQSLHTMGLPLPSEEVREGLDEPVRWSR